MKQYVPCRLCPYSVSYTHLKGIEARNELFKDDFPREYQTWTETAKTDFESEFNGNIAVDALEKRPEMVILWAGYALSLIHICKRIQRKSDN